MIKTFDKSGRLVLDYKFTLSYGLGSDGVYACLFNGNRLLTISKYPTAPRFNGNISDLRTEICIYSMALIYPQILTGEFIHTTYLIDHWDTSSIWQNEKTFEICEMWLKYNIDDCS